MKKNCYVLQSLFLTMIKYKKINIGIPWGKFECNS